MTRWWKLCMFAVLGTLGSGACGASSPDGKYPKSGENPCDNSDLKGLPKELLGKIKVASPREPAYTRALAKEACKKAGDGGISSASVVQLTADIPIWRMWSGPAKKYAGDTTNRLGQWWSYEAPRGKREDYRKRYEICAGWNDLTWMARCTLKKGAVVVIGPGNSANARACGDPTGAESYDANDRNWQIWIAKAWERAGAGGDLDCPAETADYEADCLEISRPKQADSTCDGPQRVGAGGGD